MIVCVFSAQPYDEQYLRRHSQNSQIQWRFFPTGLSLETCELAQGAEQICAFVNDVLDENVLNRLKTMGIKAISLRCAGYNNLALDKAKALGFSLARVPAYSPQAVAEHVFALILTLNRKTHKAYNRSKENNFNLDGLMGFNLSHKTFAVVGTGKIGMAVARIAKGFGCELIGVDPSPNPEFSAMGEYLDWPSLLTRADIVSLHCPLTPDTQHLIDSHSLKQLKPGAMLINTGRGALIDTQAAITALKSGQLAHLGLDVYEQESELFFGDHSLEVIQDDTFERLLTFPNVLITGHQGFFTHEALTQIAQTTVANILAMDKGTQAPGALN